MSSNRILVLDNEALQAVADRDHPKHTRMLAVLEARTERGDRRPGDVQVLTTTTVRVEALIDRRVPKTARLNRLRVLDVALDGARADRAATLRHQAGGAVADATVAEAAISAAGDGADVTVYTADLSDLPALMAVRVLRVRIVRI